MFKHKIVRKITMFMYSFSYLYVLYCALDTAKINSVFPFIHYRTWLSWVFTIFFFTGIVLYMAFGDYLKKEKVGDAEIGFITAKPASGTIRYIMLVLYIVVFLYIPLFYFPVYADKFAFLIFGLYMFAGILFFFAYSDSPILYSPMFVFSIATYYLLHENGTSYLMVPFKKLGVAVDYFVWKKAVKVVLIGNNLYYII